MKLLCENLNCFLFCVKLLVDEPICLFYFLYRGIKCQVYKTYRTWLNGVGASAYMGENAAKLIAHIMNDAHLQESPQQVQ